MGLSLEHLAAEIAASPLAVYSLDRDGRVASWNAAAAELYRRPAAEVVGGAPPRADGIQTISIALDDGALVVAQQRPADREHQLRVILDAIPAPIFYKDADGIYRGCNKAFEAYLGKAHDEIVGKDVFGLSPRDLAEVYKRADDELFASRSVQIYEAAVRYADGSRHDVMFHKATFDDADGGLAGLVGTILDITTRKRAEHALRESERDLAATHDALGAGVIRTDVEGRILRMNRVAEAMTGWPQDEARGRALDEICAMSGDGDGLVLRARNDAARAIAATTTALPAAEGAVTVLRDVADERRAREAQRAMQERLAVAERMSSVGTLASGVAHEINNPLSYVIGNLTLLDEELRRQGAGELRQLVTEALDGSERIRRIVRDLRTFARADDDQRGPISVPRVLELALAVAGNEIRHRARLARELADVPPVIGNEARLGQVLVNLLVNAAQAIPEGDAEHHEIRIACRFDGERVVVEVHDTGGGIPEAIRGRIFEPFFTTKPIGTGAGLGLAASHGIVTGMGGELTVESELGRGSVFRVSLPAAPGARPRAAEPVAPRTGGSTGARARILIADDEPIVTRTLTRFLTRAHDVTVAASGREALDAIAAARFDVILCDLMMPEMTGMDIHAALVERDPATADRMIFMTGGAFTARARAFLDAVSNARLEKPFTIATLEALIRERVG
jgi:PAS domain S-box-containing protein